MKKIFLIFTVCALSVLSTPVHAQPRGRAAQSGMSQGSSDWAWGIGIVGLAFLGVLGGVIASSATDSPTTFSH